MLSTKKNRIITILTTIVILLWGIIIYRVYTFFIDSDNKNNEIIPGSPTSKIHAGKNNPPEFFDVEYIKLSRDPFTFNRANSIGDLYSNRTVRKPLIIPPQNSPPLSKTEYRINGTILNDNSKLVIIEDLTINKTFFLKEGESYNEITIKKIDKNEITITVEKELKVLSLH